MECISSILFNRLKGDNLFNDNRSCVVHVLDSLYRAESHLPRFTSVIENCVNELATKSVVLTTQDISAVLRVFQRYRDTNSNHFCLALQKVAIAMNERIIKGGFVDLAKLVKLIVNHDFLTIKVTFLS